MIMSLFHHQEPASNPSKKYRFLKDALATCHTFCRKISSQTLQQQDDHGDDDDDDDDVIDYDDEQEIFVSAVLSKYKESKSKRKVGLTVDSFIWEFEFELGLGFSPTEPPLTKKEKHYAYASDVEDHMDEFYSPCSHLSRCSSATTAGAFMSVKTNLSRCSSMSSFEFPVFRRRRPRSMFLELCHCEGWPFGLCRKALLVPPLPKSPSESWMWRKSTRLVKIP